MKREDFKKITEKHFITCNIFICNGGICSEVDCTTEDVCPFHSKNSTIPKTCGSKYRKEYAGCIFDEDEKLVESAKEFLKFKEEEMEEIKIKTINMLLVKLKRELEVEFLRKKDLHKKIQNIKENNLYNNLKLLTEECGENESKLRVLSYVFSCRPKSKLEAKEALLNIQKSINPNDDISNLMYSFITRLHFFIENEED